MNADWTLIKQQLIEEIKPAFDNVPLPCSFEKGIDYFYQLLQLPCPEKTVEDLEQTITNNLKNLLGDTDKETKRTNLKNFTINLDAFVKKVLFFKDRTTYNDLKNERKGLKDHLEALDLKDRNVVNAKILRHINTTHTFRNKIAHQAQSLSRKQIINYTESVIVTYLQAIFLYYELIEKQQFTQQYKQYTLQVKAEFERWQKRFVALDSKEFMMEMLAVERTDLYLNQPATTRKGTIDWLRKNKVSEKRMIVWGQAGTGKTTTLQYLAYKDAKTFLDGQSLCLPLYLELKYAKNNFSILQTLQEKLTTSLANVQTLLTEGKVNLFIDGLNEVSKQIRTQVYRDLETLVKRYPNTFLIFAGRMNQGDTFKGVPIFQLQPMTDSQILEFLSKHTNKKSLTRKKIAAAIKTDEQLKNIVKTPLLLHRLIWLLDNNPHELIPKSEGRIMKAFLDSILKREEKQDVHLPFRQVNQLLMQLGYMGFELTQTNAALTEDEVMEIWEEVSTKRNMQVSLYHVLKKAIELNILQKKNDAFAFAHQAYQSYYHAQVKMSQKNRWKRRA